MLVNNKGLEELINEDLKEMDMENNLYRTTSEYPSQIYKVRGKLVLIGSELKPNNYFLTMGKLEDDNPWGKTILHDT